MKEQINIDAKKLQATCDLMRSITVTFSGLIADIKKLEESNPELASYAKDMIYSAVLYHLAADLQIKSAKAEANLDAMILGIAPQQD